MPISRCLLLTLSCLLCSTLTAQINSFTTWFTVGQTQYLRAVAIGPAESIFMAGHGPIDTTESTDIRVVRVDSLGQGGWALNLNARYKDKVWDATGSPNGMVAIGEVADSLAPHQPWVFAISQNGQLAWSKRYSFPESTRFQTIEAASDGGWLIVGTTGNPSSGTTPSRGLFCKLDAQGQFLWGRNLYQTTANTTAHALRVTEAKPGQYTVLLQIDHFDQAAAVATFDQNGNLIAQNHFRSSTGQVQLEGMTGTPDGGVLLSGTDSRNILIKLDAQLQVEWAQQYGNYTSVNYGEVLADVVVLSDGSYLCRGGGVIPTLYRMDTTGTFLEGYNTPIDAGYCSQKMDLSPSGAVIFTADRQCGNWAGFNGLVISRTNARADEVCERFSLQAEGLPIAFFSPLALAADEITGVSSSSQNAEIEAHTMVPYEQCRTTHAPVASREAIRLEAWPQPAQGPVEISIQTPQPESVHIEFYDLQGRLIEQHQLWTNGPSLRILEQESPAGTYLLRAQTESGATAQKKILHYPQ